MCKISRVGYYFAFFFFEIRTVAAPPMRATAAQIAPTRSVPINGRMRSIYLSRLITKITPLYHATDYSIPHLYSIFNDVFVISSVIIDKFWF